MALPMIITDTRLCQEGQAAAAEDADPKAPCCVWGWPRTEDEGHSYPRPPGWEPFSHVTYSMGFVAGVP